MRNGKWMVCLIPLSIRACAPIGSGRNDFYEVAQPIVIDGDDDLTLRPSEKFLTTTHSAAITAAGEIRTIDITAKPPVKEDSMARIYQLQPGLTDQLAHAFAQPADHLGQRQHHLYRRISFGSHFCELFHRSLRFNLIWFLHSDSPFSRQKKIALSLSRLRARVATSYDLPGIP
jgi:hypothetical protein